MTYADTVSAARSLLFVPGNKPERFAKAEGSGADAIILDLEDAVEDEQKAQARRNVVAWLNDGHEAVVRINAPASAHHAADLEALAGLGIVAMVAKSETVESLAPVIAVLGERSRVIALIESPAGVLAATELARSESVIRLAFGTIDYAKDLGIDEANRDALLTPRTMLALASAAAWIAQPLDGVTTTFTDDDVIRQETVYAAGLGFSGKLCIHPRQLPAVHSGFLPSAEELSWAEAVLAAAPGGQAIAVDGRMVDRPVIARAEQIVERSRG